MVMTAGSLLSQAAVRYQLTPLWGRTFLRALLWHETKGVSLKWCCCASQACLWTLVADRDCSSNGSNGKCCHSFCVYPSWQMHFGVKRKFARLFFKPLFIYPSTWVPSSHVAWAFLCPVGLCNHSVWGDYREEKSVFNLQKPQCIVKATVLKF